MSEEIIAALISAVATLGASFMNRKGKQQQPVSIHIGKEAEKGANAAPQVKPTALPNVYTPDHYIVTEIGSVLFDVTFVAVDDETLDDLYVEQPVLLFIFDPNDPEEAVLTATELGQGLRNGELYPGEYSLLALVYEDDELEYIDAIGIADFTIEEDEPPFELNVPVSSDEDILAGLLGVEPTFVGNRINHVYHLPSCARAYQIAANSRIIFPSQEVAEEHGYKPCPLCADVSRHTISCPSCTQLLNIPADRGSLTVHCPTCGEQWKWSA